MFGICLFFKFLAAELVIKSHLLPTPTLCLSICQKLQYTYLIDLILIMPPSAIDGYLNKKQRYQMWYK